MIDFIESRRQIKPVVFIQSDKSPDITVSGLSAKIDAFKKQKISGIKLQSFVDLEDKIDEGLKKGRH